MENKFAAVQQNEKKKKKRHIITKETMIFHAGEETKHKTGCIGKQGRQSPILW